MIPSEDERCAEGGFQLSQRKERCTDYKPCMSRVTSRRKIVDVIQRVEHVVEVGTKQERCAHSCQEEPESQIHISGPQQAQRDEWSMHDDYVHGESAQVIMRPRAPGAPFHAK